MKKEITEQLISNIDEKYITEALQYQGKKDAPVHKKGKDHWLIRVCKVAACLAFVYIVGFSAIYCSAKAGNTKAFEILEALYPDLAMNMMPVNAVSSDQGIVMEVDSIYVHDDSAEIYITFQDTTGDRIDATTDLFDSYDIHTSADQIGTCSRVDYDEEEKKATFLISVQQNRGKKITGERMTFSVNELLSGKKHTNLMINEIDLSNVPENVETQTGVPIRGWEYRDEGNDIEVTKFISADREDAYSPVDGVKIMGVAMIDGYLHLQVYYENVKDFDDHGLITLKGPDGSMLNEINNISFFDDDQIGSYDEYVYNVNGIGNLADYKVYGEFITSNQLTKGNWSVTFPIDSSKKED